MNYKIAFIIAVILIGAVLGWAIYIKIVQPSELQKAKGNIINQNTTYEFRPFGLFGGCIRLPVKEDK